MIRRKFFKSLVAGGGAISLSTLITTCTPCKEPSTNTFSFKIDFELDEIDVDLLQEKLNSGKLTSVELVRKYTNRIAEIDTNGPCLGSIIELNPDAETIADQLDKERKSGKLRGPLHGIPIVIKDNIDTGDKMSTSAGSLAIKDFKAKKDAFIVERLRESGAILLGKSNLSEWANFRSTQSSSGWSGRGGQVKNPYVIDRNPCGSSSGTGVAISANLCTIGIGTETDGSIVCPGGINGIVGIKPTVGLWSRTGIIPISSTQDTAGPMARTVKDAAYLLGALTGVDKIDTASVNSEGNAKSDYSKSCVEDGLLGAKIGVLRNYFGFDTRVDQIMESSILSMNNAGAVIVDNLEFTPKNEIGQYEWNLLLFEFKHTLNEYFRLHPNSPIKSLQELIVFNTENEAESMTWFKQELFEMAQAKGDLSSDEYKEAYKNSKIVAQKALDNLFTENQLDALVAPTNGPAWKTDYLNGDHFKGGSSSPAAVSGYPSITVPAGFINELPIGISFIGKDWSESTLIKIAYSFEQKTKIRKKPKFISSLEG